MGDGAQEVPSETLLVGNDIHSVRTADESGMEDQEYGADSDGYSIADELAFPAARLAQIEALRERLEAEAREAQGLDEGEAPVIEDKA